MKKIIISLGIIFTIQAGYCFGTCVDDTIPPVNRKINCGMTSTFVNAVNWKGTTINSLAFSTDASYCSNVTGETSVKIFSVKTEVGYTFYLDSIWNKHADRFESQFILKNKTHRIDNALSLMLTAQLFNTYNYQYDVAANRTIKNKKGGFMNPSDFTAGYGFGWTFWENSIVNLSIASVKIQITPIDSKEEPIDKMMIGRWNQGWVMFEYGLSTQIVLFKTFCKKIDLNSTSKFFFNGRNAVNMQMDMVHKINYSIWKWFQFRADVKIVYDPLFSGKLQYRNELLLGVFYDSTKKFN